MATLLTVTAEDLESAPRPVRVGADLTIEDQAMALIAMAPPALSACQARTWLASHVFVVTRTGRLDRHQNRPVAQLRTSA